jgi:hypothetical protein
VFLHVTYKTFSGKQNEYFIEEVLESISHIDSLIMRYPLIFYFSDYVLLTDIYFLKSPPR